MSRYQKGKTNLDFTGARDSEWQWHQLGHMQFCTSLQTDNSASTPPLSFYRLDALPATQPAASMHWRPCTDCTANDSHTTVKFSTIAGIFLVSYFYCWPFSRQVCHSLVLEENPSGCMGHVLGTRCPSCHPANSAKVIKETGGPNPNHPRCLCWFFVWLCHPLLWHCLSQHKLQIINSPLESCMILNEMLF